MNRKIDPESQALWDEFWKAQQGAINHAPTQADICCRVSQASLDACRRDKTQPIVTFGGFSVPLKHCPGCGRELR